MCFIQIAASGPVRLFTPYKRRRRNQLSAETTNDSVQAKVKKVGEEEPETEEGVKEENTWESITDGIDGNNEFIDSTSQSM